jgi:alkylation response protein AidB-like acyl-CoA dehydrogenase
MAATVSPARPVFDHDHELFRESARAYCDRALRPAHERIREQKLIDRELWLEAGRHDFLGVGVPAEYGGSGVDDFRFNAVWGEELARVALAFASSFGIHTDVVAPYLVELTTEEQKQRWLPRFCTGELTTAIGMTEPSAGSDLAGLRTTARRDGGDWIVNGSKTFITNGTSADLVLVAARTGDARHAISLLVVEEGMPGFARGRKLDKVGQPEADTGELFFEDVRVPDANLIGEVGAGFRHMMERLPQERISAAVGNVEHAWEAVRITLEYVRERQAFGRPIGTFQHNRFLLAELVTELDVTRTYVDRCLERHVAGELGPVDAAKAKYWSAQVQNRVIDACVQLHGGYGYMTEYAVARAFQDARVTPIWAGSNEIMKEVIGRDLGLGDPRPA